MCHSPSPCGRGSGGGGDADPHIVPTVLCPRMDLCLRQDGRARPDALHDRADVATTAAGLAESARLLLEGECHGICLQSQLDPERFLGGPFVGTIYGSS